MQQGPLPIQYAEENSSRRTEGLLSVGSTGGRDYDRRELFLGEEFGRQPTESARLELLQRYIDMFPDIERASPSSCPYR